MKKLVTFEMPEGMTLQLESRDYDSYRFQECSKFQEKSIGFTETAFGEYMTDLGDKVKVLNVRTQKKVPEKSHINHLVKQKVNKLESVGEFVTKEQLSNIQDDCRSEVISKTFPKEPEDCTIVVKDNLIFVESNSYKNAEKYIDLLENLLSVRIAYAIMEEDPTFTNILVDTLPDPWVLGSEAKFLDIDGKVVTFRKADLSCDLAKKLIKDGAELEIVELEYDSVITIKLNAAFEIASIKYSKDMIDESEEDYQGTLMLKIREVVKMFKSLKGLCEVM